MSCIEQGVSSRVVPHCPTNTTHGARDPDPPVEAGLNAVQLIPLALSFPFPPFLVPLSFASRSAMLSPPALAALEPADPPKRDENASFPPPFVGRRFAPAAVEVGGGRGAAGGAKGDGTRWRLGEGVRVVGWAAER